MQFIPEASKDFVNSQDSLGKEGTAFLAFPEGFLWGVSTSHFQIEGHPDEIEKRLSDWAIWVNTDGKISDSSSAEKTCDFFSRYEADIELCKRLNLNTFRLSLNWPALCPGQNECFSKGNKSVAYYRELLKTLKGKGLTTFVTLSHFCLPSWLAEIGGWNNPLIVEEFTKFTRRAVEEYGDLVDYWLTINEPLAYAYQGYLAGVWPPGYKGDYLGAFRAIAYMLAAHASAYQAIHEIQNSAKVSFTLHWMPFQPRNQFNPLDQLSRYLRDQVFNHVFMRAIETGNLQFPLPISLQMPLQDISGPIPGLQGSLDYLAINYYTREICEFKFAWPLDLFGSRSNHAEFATSGLGWEIYPKGLYDLLTRGLNPYRLDKNGKPREIYITENGLASVHPADLLEGDWSLNDEARIHYLISHLMATHYAIAAGVNVKGYLHWSLMDNFEWAEGLKARFGLVRVTYPTLERVLRKSAMIYAEIARHNGFDRNMWREPYKK